MPESDQPPRIPTEAQRAANHRALREMHRANRFRLMFGQPLLPEPEKKPRSVADELRAEANRLKDERCAAFPNLICNETAGLAFDAWCEPCKARRLVRFFAAEDARGAKARVGNCPLERQVAAALDEAGIVYRTDYEGAVPENLDFYLPEQDLFIEVKGGHSDRIAKQMERAPNVIAVQGAGAVRFIVRLLLAYSRK